MKYVDGELEEESVADPRGGGSAGLGEAGVEARAAKVGALQVWQPNAVEESPELGMDCRRERHAGDASTAGARTGDKKRRMIIF
jgi:hypothetical protein